MLLGTGMLTLTVLAAPAAATESQSLYCIDEVDNPPIQTFTVPSGISQLQMTVHGAHGGNPDHGGQGGYAGMVQATFAVGPSGPLRPGQQLDVWVGCYGDEPVGAGYGGAKGSGDHDGATGGGGSAIFDHASQATYVVAGGGGGGGGSASEGGGDGGDGGAEPQAGEGGHGDGGGDGGCAQCQPPGEVNGLAGGSPSGPIPAGGGGGGGGGYTGGGGGTAGQGDLDNSGGGGGGGAGESFVASAATSVAQATSQLADDGLVGFYWNDSQARDPDGDGVPNAHDRCRHSILDDTVLLGRCDSRAANDLKVDGCTITDRIVRIAQRTDTRTQFLRQTRRLAAQLRQAEDITRVERRAIMQCVHKVNVAKLRQ
jgi:hypothetical protein